MTDAEETLARLRIYLRERIAEAREATRGAPPDSVESMWGHVTGEELTTVQELIGDDQPPPRHLRAV